MPPTDLGSLTVKADLVHLPALTAFVSETAAKLGMGQAELFQLELAIEEAATNVIKFAYPQGDGELTVAAMQDEKGLLLLEILDQGAPFNPLEQDEPDLEADIEDRPIGGLGIVLILNVMDKVEYYRVDGRNILRLAKKVKKEDQD